MCLLKKAGAQEKVLAKEKYQKRVEELKKEHQQILSKLSEHQEIKDEKYVYKNRLFDAKMELQKDYQTIKDRRHAAYSYKYHLIDLLRMSKFTFLETRAQKWRIINIRSVKEISSFRTDYISLFS